MLKSLKGALCALALCVAPAALAADKGFGLGQAALPEEIRAWDIDVRPDGQGLPPGKGTVAQGEKLFLQRCASCHGEFGEGVGRWPALSGGKGSLTSEEPEKTISSFWPFVSSVYDYIHRAMPFGDAQSLAPDETYALVAYLLSMDDIVPADFELNDKNFASIRMPNEGAFHPDDRLSAEKQFWNREPCMKDCKAEVKILSHARVLNVTPDVKDTTAKVD
jgi:cytochrome c